VALHLAVDCAFEIVNGGKEHLPDLLVAQAIAVDKDLSPLHDPGMQLGFPLIVPPKARCRDEAEDTLWRSALHHEVAVFPIIRYATAAFAGDDDASARFHDLRSR